MEVNIIRRGGHLTIRTGGREITTMVGQPEGSMRPKHHLLRLRNRIRLGMVEKEEGKVGKEVEVGVEERMDLRIRELKIKCS